MSKENPLWEAPRLHDEPCAIMRMPSARRVAGSVSRAAGPADAASHTRPADMATNAGDQCATGAFGRARYCGSARTRGAQAVAEDHRGRKSLIVTASLARALLPPLSRTRRHSGRVVIFAAWIGLVPREDSTGGKRKLGPISKQGDRYLRRILVVGAHSVLRRAKQNPEKYPWLTQLLARRPFKVVAIALANKMARVA